MAIARRDEGAAHRVLNDLLEVGDVRRALRQLAGLLVSVCEDLERAAVREVAALRALCDIGAEVAAEESVLHELQQQQGISQ